MPWQWIGELVSMIVAAYIGARWALANHRATSSLDRRFQWCTDALQVIQDVQSRRVEASVQSWLPEAYREARDRLDRLRTQSRAYLSFGRHARFTVDIHSFNIAESDWFAARGEHGEDAEEALEHWRKGNRVLWELADQIARELDQLIAKDPELSVWRRLRGRARSLLRRLRLVGAGPFERMAAASRGRPANNE